MPAYLIVAVRSVTLHEDGTRTVQINCPVCNLQHEHVWPLTDSDIGYRVAGCDPSIGYSIQIPEWATHSENQRSYRNREQSVASQRNASYSRPEKPSTDDGAIHEHVPNWLE